MPLDRVLRSARICGYVGQTVLIYQRPDGVPYCNFQENSGCKQVTDECRLRDVQEELDKA